MFSDFKDEKVSFSLPSLRIDSFSIDLAHKMQQVRKVVLPLHQRLVPRDCGMLSTRVLLRKSYGCYRGGFPSGLEAGKAVFYDGTATETDEDIVGIAKLAEKVARKYKEVTGRWGVTVTISVSCFVPKPHTPFQWYGQLPEAEFHRRQRLLKDSITERAVSSTIMMPELACWRELLPEAIEKSLRLFIRPGKDGAKI